MPLNDDNLGWNRGRKFFHFRLMDGILDDSTSGVPAALAAGNMTFAEISAAFEVAGMQIGADADEVYHWEPIWEDLDITQPLRFRVWFVHTATDADEPIFAVAYKGVGKQAAVSDIKSSPDETVTFGAHTCSTTANSLEVTDWAESNSQSYLTLTDFLLGLALTVNTMAASANEILGIGLEVQYTKRAAPNPQRHITLGQPTSGSGPND